MDIEAVIAIICVLGFAIVIGGVVIANVVDSIPKSEK